MNSAFFPGSFDPPTLGHLNLIERASKLCDQLYVVIAFNKTKKNFFSPQERYDLLKDLLKNYPNVQLCIWDKLVVDFAKEKKIPLMFRGVRALADFSYEFELAMMNKALYPDLEVIFLPSNPQYFVLRSSSIREIASFGGEIESMVCESVAEAIRKKINQNQE